MDGAQAQAGLMTYVLREPLAVDVRQLLADGDRGHQPEVRQPRHLAHRLPVVGE